ncbi:MerR family transcriptional regulator [Dethiosulfovibrio sp. F2B]|uniref:MerR family transcriptional regulator n=1 Tax=Dethiosulfovibrio faecalis TaxID=2720018 RepID=UPI001F15E85E|nr:MerR family transcriptional regulator [Dethiosulfovibrio faecalis]MCF4151063.1 MerR family transcriptional regulator [Dethiosulfovibrio faecalis]
MTRQDPSASTLLIGQFSKLSGLSPRMLRFYAEQGILTPTHTDSDTGYRYYSDSQLEEAERLLRLRRADFSVDDVRRIICGDGGKGFRSLILEQRENLINRMGSLEDSLRILDELEAELGDEEAPPTEASGLPGNPDR